MQTDAINPPPKKSRQFFSFIEIGLGEIVFVLIILSLFFSILNYFNIISLSTLYPRGFGWLSHQSREQVSPPPFSVNQPPISLNSSELVSGYYSYVFDSTITSVQQLGNNTIITLDFHKQHPQIPAFILSAQTVVQKGTKQNDKFIETGTMAHADIKAGAAVRVNVSYFPAQKKWYIYKLFVVSKT